MITIEETYNLKLIKEILAEPSLFALSHGIDKDPTTFEVDLSFTHLLAKENGKPIGIFTVKQFTKIVAEVHINILPEYWKTGMGSKASYAAIEWMLTNTNYKKIFTTVPVSSIQVLKLCQKLGWEACGTIKDGICFNGQIQDLILFNKDLARSV